MSQAANATAQRAFVLGGGIVGVCCAYALQRSGFTTTLIEKGAPGHAASFGNSASIGLASVPPLGMPGMMRNLPRMLMDPNHALVIRLRHLPQTLPWLMRFRRTLSPVRVQAITNARAGLLSHAGNAYKSLLVEIGRTELIRTTGLIFAYESRRYPLRARGPGWHSAAATASRCRSSTAPRFATSSPRSLTVPSAVSISRSCRR